MTTTQTQAAQNAALECVAGLVLPRCTAMHASGRVIVLVLDEPGNPTGKTARPTQADTQAAIGFLTAIAQREATP